MKRATVRVEDTYAEWRLTKRTLNKMFYHTEGFHKAEYPNTQQIYASAHLLIHQGYTDYYTPTKRAKMKIIDINNPKCWGRCGAIRTLIHY